MPSAKSSRFLPFALVGLVVLALAAWMIAKNARPPGPAPEPETAVPEVATGPVQDGTQSGLPQRLSADAPLVRAQARDPGSQSLLGPPTDPAKLKAEREALLAQLESAHAAEPVDAAWAGQAEPALSDLAARPEMAVAGFKPDQYKADCRSRSCRITATFDDADDARDWGEMLITGSGKVFNQSRLLVVPTADGRQEVRIFGSRR